VGERDGRTGVVTPGEPLLVFDAAVVGYASPVVGPVSFSVMPGQIVGLVGSNGCGKTTLVNAVLGTARVFEGAVRLKSGVRVTVQRQRPVRLPEMPLTGLEVLGLAQADRHPLPPAIQPFASLRVDRLSGGQYQLLQVWACLGSPTDLVMLDEPTSNMDSRTKELVAELVKASLRLVQGILVISHEHGFLEQVASRVVRIEP
jgi:ATPase subunit of ABC transporter with duplicated ATPase domains